MGEPYQLFHADALHVLRSLPSESVDAVITDPPYSSGGFTRGDRTQSTGHKYVQTGTQLIRPDFAGDNRDQRGYLAWSQLWMSQALRIVKPSGYLLTFTDWRQLPVTTDAVQAGGFVWRGLIAWDKGRSARAPHTGYFRHQAEYVVWGTRGVSRPAAHAGPFDGVIREPVVLAEKMHQTGKPVKLMEKLVEVVPPGGVVLDPFAGSGSTGVAAIRTGRRFIGVEIDDAYHAIASQRLATAESQRASILRGLEQAARGEVTAGPAFGEQVFPD